MLTALFPFDTTKIPSVVSNTFIYPWTQFRLGEIVISAFSDNTYLKKMQFAPFLQLGTKRHSLNSHINWIKIFPLRYLVWQRYCVNLHNCYLAFPHVTIKGMTKLLIVLFKVSPPLFVISQVRILFGKWKLVVKFANKSCLFSSWICKIALLQRIISIQIIIFVKYFYLIFFLIFWHHLEDNYFCVGAIVGSYSEQKKRNLSIALD